MNKDRLNIFTRSILVASMLTGGCAPVVVASEKIVSTKSSPSTSVPTRLPTVTPTETEIPRPTPKIMILGDSITEFGFGEGLVKAIENEGVKGDFTITGRGGFTTRMILKDLRDGKINVDDDIPDILLIELGTNDVLRGKYDVSETFENMESIILFFRGKNPNVKIVLFLVIPSNHAGRDQKCIQEINQAYAELSVSLTTPISPIIIATDVSPGFDIEKDLTDGVHPSPSGYDKMIASAIVTINTFLDIPQFDF